MTDVSAESLSLHPPVISGVTKLYGCIAHPSAHVRAPSIFNPIFRKNGTDAVMVPVNCPPEHLETVVRGLNGLKNFGGLAVTIPHKLPLACLCDDLGDGARATGAVNAVRFDDDGKIYGNNFDGEGFVAGLIGEGYQLQGKRVLLLGAGGAARAVAVAVAHHGCAHLDIANRTLQKAEAAADLPGRFTSKSSVGTTMLATADLGSYDIVINATSVGLHDDDPHPVLIDRLASDCLVCDIIMVPDRTNWLIAAEQSGRPVHKGRHMLDYQLELIGRFIGAFD